MEHIINRIQTFIWLAIAIAAAAGIIFAGAWWHIPSAAIAYLMYRMFKESPESPEEAKEDGSHGR